MTDDGYALYQRRGRWRDQIFADKTLSHAAFRVGYALAAYMTMDKSAAKFHRTGRVIVFPSYDTLSHDASVSLDTVRVSINQLVERSHLERLQRGNSYTGSSRYRILFKSRERIRPRDDMHRGNSAEQPRKFRDTIR